MPGALLARPAPLRQAAWRPSVLTRGDAGDDMD